jgi:Ca2+-dependent lipid-binding protein
MVSLLDRLCSYFPADQVVRAERLSTQEKHPKSLNSYVKVQIDDVVEHTSLVNQTTNPSWNDEFKL